MAHPRFPSAEIARRGQELYDRTLRGTVEKDHFGEFLAVDIESGQFEIGSEHLETAKRALAKNPAAALFVVKIGYPSAARIGGRYSSSMLEGGR